MNNKNILEEIEESIIKKGDASYTSINICIKNNNIFGMLFISEFIPNFSDIMQIIQNLMNINSKEENSIFTLIICICSEEKEDFEKTLSMISKLSCFILPYNSDLKEKIINKFNIVLLPSLLLFDKEGLLLESLNNDEIGKITFEKIKGWKNNLSHMQRENAKKIRKYFIGQEGSVFGHEHILFYSDYLCKNPSYGKGNWYCDICGARHLYSDNNFYCDLCGYDVCDYCYEKNKKY